MAEKKERPEIAESLRGVSLEELHKRRQEIYAAELGDIEIAIRILTDEQRREGKAVDSVDELVCERHPGAKFVVDGSIDRTLRAYNCEVCAEGKDESFFRKPAAYECPTCRIVKGSPSKEPFDYPGSLGGCAGIIYHCTICDNVVGEEEFKHY